MAGHPLLSLAAVLLTVAVVVAAMFASLAPEPYMDEPFHVPQTQKYCQGRWREWDPKITTFPGLYLFGAAAGRVHAAALGAVGRPPTPLCGTGVLRSVNLLFAAACLPLFYATARDVGTGRSQAQLLLMTTAAFLFPLHFFFSFLYYTDVPSLFLTLASYLAAVRYQRYRLAGLLGAAAVLMRQTNAVWVAFALAAAVLDRCLPAGKDGSSSKMAEDERHGKRRQSGDHSVHSSNSGSGVAELPAELACLLRQAWLLKWRLAADLWPLAAVVAAFAAFVVANGGIVVGDKSHHAPVRHLVQPLYCLLYCTAWLAPVYWSPTALRRAMRTLRNALARRPVATLGALIGGTAALAVAIQRFTLVHPFLLADNRHYTFYLWRRLLNSTPWARYALIPAYAYAAWAVAQSLSHRRPTWVAGLAGATAVVLVPAHLVEFRYFTVPFYLLFFHVRTPSTRALAAIVALFAAANAAAMYLFLARPFAWGDGSVARFMW